MANARIEAAKAFKASGNTFQNPCPASVKQRRWGRCFALLSNRRTPARLKFFKRGVVLFSDMAISCDAHHKFLTIHSGFIASVAERKRHFFLLNRIEMP